METKTTVISKNNCQNLEASQAKRSLKRSLWERIWEQKILFLFLLPGAVIVIIFNYIPMAGIVMAFQDFNLKDGFLQSPFVGLKHFDAFLSDPDFLNALQNTLSISVLSILIGFPLPIILALMIDSVSSVWFKKTVQTITYLPHFINWVVLASLLYRLLDAEAGIVNTLIRALGGDAIAFMRQPAQFWGVLVTSSIWKEIGWNSIIYLAAITSLDPQLHDAAQVDGANVFQRMIYITLPGILPTIALMFILALGSLVTVNFEAVFNLNNPFVNSRAEVIDIYVYRTGLLMGRYSYAAAVGLAQSAISCALVLVGFIISQRINRDYNQ